MRYARGHKERTRAKILRAAGRVFRREGYHAAGVDKVMEDAGLTAGGFYAHFESKEALLAEALGPAAAEAEACRDKDLEGVAGRAWVEAFVERYLSLTHRDKPEEGCPLPALVSEIARSGGLAKASFEAIILDLSDRLQSHAGKALAEDHALALIALCVGGLGVARAVQDEDLGERILAACRDLARTGQLSDGGAQAPVARPREPSGPKGEIDRVP